jgi:NAD-dependent DNA ligase
VENIIQAILEKTEIPLDKFLSALGIEFVGKKTARLIMEEIGRSSEEVRRIVVEEKN